MVDKKANWGKLGGNASMHRKTGVGTQKPGVGSQEGSNGGLSRSIDPQAGPPGSYYGSNNAASNKDYAGTQAPGVSAATKSGGDGKWAAGGPASAIAPNRGSVAAQPGKSSAY